MMTVFLRFPDIASALGAFSAVTGAQADELSDVPSKVFVGDVLVDIDVIGPVDVSFGEVDASAAPIVGFRVNLWLPDDAVLPDALSEAVVAPVNPSRVFA